MARKGESKGRRGRDNRAEIRELVEDIDFALDYPSKAFNIMTTGPDNSLYYEMRDRLHELSADDLPEVKRIDRKLVSRVATYGKPYYDQPEDREGKPLSYWWWWLDKIMDGKLSKDLLPEHVRDLIS